ncbi:hypothetical protein S40285_09796, partial [Stachybotrys chlorohalonatus IBT 40285]
QVKNARDKFKGVHTVGL